MLCVKRDDAGQLTRQQKVLDFLKFGETDVRISRVRLESGGAYECVKSVACGRKKAG